MTNNNFIYDRAFDLELGESLSGFTLAYSTLGTLNNDKSNVIWVCHALTGNPDVDEWWSGLFGEDKIFNPNEHFIICANILGGCNGSTGPLSINPETNEIYGHDFPELTNRDMVSAFNLLREYLGIDQIKLLIGASLGGQHVLEWSIMFPDSVENLICMAANAKRSPWSVAFNESQRRAIQLDPTWSENNRQAGIEGMKLARTIALLSYRGYDIYNTSQTELDNNKVDDLRASSYQRYQGEKLAARFNAFTYMLLTKAMDSHNILRGRGNDLSILEQVKAKCLFIGISSDLLFPYQEQVEMSANIRKSKIVLMDSAYGHDGFLVENEKIINLISNFFSSKEK